MLLKLVVVIVKRIASYKYVSLCKWVGRIKRVPYLCFERSWHRLSFITSWLVKNFFQLFRRKFTCSLHAKFNMSNRQKYSERNRNKEVKPEGCHQNTAANKKKQGIHEKHYPFWRMMNHIIRLLFCNLPICIFSIPFARFTKKVRDSDAKRQRNSYRDNSNTHRDQAKAKRKKEAHYRCQYHYDCRVWFVNCTRFFHSISLKTENVLNDFNINGVCFNEK